MSHVLLTEEEFKTIVYDKNMLLLFTVLL